MEGQCLLLLGALGFIVDEKGLVISARFWSGIHGRIEKHVNARFSDCDVPGADDLITAGRGSWIATFKPVRLKGGLKEATWTLSTNLGTNGGTAVNFSNSLGIVGFRTPIKVPGTSSTCKVPTPQRSTLVCFPRVMASLDGNTAIHIPDSFSTRSHVVDCGAETPGACIGYVTRRAQQSLHLTSNYAMLYS